jgi:Xaa-Pro aminopeptidase
LLPRSSVLLVVAPLSLAAQDIPRGEYADRRRALMERLPDGITLLHASPREKPESEPGFIQSASFFYLTGLGGVPNAVLAVDAPRREARLFVPPAPRAFGFVVDGVVPDSSSAATLGLTQIVSWDSLVPYIRRRLSDGVKTLYVDEARRPGSAGVPTGMRPIAGDAELWAQSLSATFPDARVASAAEVIRAMRFVKSPAEVAALRDNARATASAVRAAMRAVTPGVRQRQVEIRAAHACIDAGAVGPSFWPWTMSGPNAHIPMLVRSVYSYDQLDRTMKSGETVRIDLGCTNHGYGGDVGRTVPVSGRFTAGQREIWNLAVDAYRAGMRVMKPGVSIGQVMAASRAEIERQAGSLATTEGREAARILLAPDGMAGWSLHSVGVESGETPLQTLAAGAVIAFEPIFSVGADAYYLEDMIYITATGAEVLSVGLPYTASEIEAAMRAR